MLKANTAPNSLFESQNVLKSCSLFLPDVGSAESLNLNPLNAHPEIEDRGR